MSRGFHPLEVAVIIAGPLYSITCLVLTFVLAYNNSRKETRMTVNIFDVVKNRSWEQLRALLYVVAPLVIYATIDDRPELWAGLVLAVLSGLAAWKSVTEFRTWFQTVLAALQLVLTGFGWVTEQQFTTWAQIALAVLGGSVAAANVHAAR